MKTTAVVKSLSYYKTNVLFQRIPAYFKIKKYVGKYQAAITYTACRDQQF